MHPYPNLLLLLLLSLLANLLLLVSSSPPPPPTSLFVFGDSYVDTGNHDPHSPPPISQPWRPPYGRTWPASPAGRYSDGRISTDFIASILKVSLPVPLREIDGNPRRVGSGVNFAFGGSGVFHTFGPEYPTLMHQIREFESLIFKASLHTRGYLPSSLAVIVIAGNDYTAYALKHPQKQVSRKFISKLVGQIAVGARKLYKLGFRRIAVAKIEPFGCFPASTISMNFNSCNPASETVSTVHNMLLSREITKLERLPALDLITLDLHSGFLSAIPKFGSRGLEPCCRGTMANVSCGSVDAEGKPLYSVCGDPGARFFWDEAHPTQAGWKAVSETWRNLLSFNSG